MRIIKYLCFCLVGILVLPSCSDKPSFIDYTKNSVSFKKKTYKSKELKYSMSIPEKWCLVDSGSGENAIETFEDTISDEFEHTFFGVQRRKGETNDIEKEMEPSMNTDRGVSYVKGVGMTDYFNEPAFYEHVETPYDGGGRVNLAITFKGKKDKEFYSIFISAPCNKREEEAIAMLLECIETFKPL